MKHECFRTTLPLLGLASIVVAYLVDSIDFQVYFAAADSLLSGRTDIYAADFAINSRLDYHNPPFFLIIFAPFALLSRDWAEALWVFCVLSSLFFGFKVARRLLQDAEGDAGNASALIPAVAAIFCAKYILTSVKSGNVHTIVVFLLLLGFFFIRRNKLGKGTGFTALGAAIKIFPLITVPYLAVKRQFRTIGVLVCFLVLSFIAPAIVFGPQTNFELHQTWFQHMFFDTGFHDRTGPLSHSIVSVAERFLTKMDYSEFGDIGYQAVNFVELQKETVRTFANSISGLLILFTFGLIWAAGRMRRLSADSRSLDGFANPGLDRLAFHEFGLIVALMLLVGPRTNMVYFTALFIPLVPFLSSVRELRSRLLYFAFAAVVLITCVLPLVPGSSRQRFFQALGTDLFATLIVWASLAGIIIRKSFSAGDKLRINNVLP
jgi:hypothetical protein